MSGEEIFVSAICHGNSSHSCQDIFRDFSEIFILRSTIVRLNVAA